MARNHFKTAWRNLLKNKSSLAINVLGLVTGLTSCLLISVYIIHELSYDRFHANGNRIARVIMGYSFPGNPEMKKGNFTSVRVAPVFKQAFPEVAAAVRMAKYEQTVSYRDKLFNEKKFLFADPGFFEIFNFSLLKGVPHKVLQDPNDLVITESAARKYFGSENAMGKMLKIGDTSLYLITGISKDCPSNSQIRFDFLASFSSLGISKEHEQTYWDANYTTFLLLQNEKGISSLQAKLPAFMKKEMEGKGAIVEFYLEPFTRIHLYSEYDGFEPNNSITYIYILSLVALMILIIACSTYINLSTARSIERAKEVGIRKVIGAEKLQLFWHFIGESFLLCLGTGLLSFSIAALLIPYFNQLTGLELKSGSLFSLQVLGLFLLFVLIISLLAGSYPAFILSRFQPVKVLKGTFKNSDKGQALRKSLIVFQFVISIFLMACTVAVKKQMNYIQNKKLGFDRQHVVVLPLNAKMMDHLQLLKQEFKSNPGILSVSRCVRSPVEGGGGYNMRSAAMSENDQILVTANPVDEDFVRTTGLQIIAGSGFSEQDIKDVTPELNDKKLYHFILNESAAKQLGWTPQQAVGQKMFLDNSRPGIVSGVVRDFNYESLHNPIRPFVLFPELRGRELLLKVSGNNLPETISFLEKKWKELVPGRPFEYRFLDEDFNKLYSAELKLGKIMNLFAFIAILLACIGLFGLSAYAAQQRRKEVGIRKVLGASLSQIIVSLSGDFVKLVALAILISIPVAWLALNRWMDSFAYRTGISWWIFAGAGMAAVLIAMMTVAFQSIKTAMANPVNSLRVE